MDEIEKALEYAGERWRSAQRPSPDATSFIDTAALARRQPRLRSLEVSVSLVVVAIAAVVTVAVWRPLSGAGPAGNPNGTQGAASGVRAGDHVVAQGTVVAVPGEPVILCRPLAYDSLRGAFGSPAPSSCSTVRVKLIGIDMSTLPAAQVDGQTIVATNVVVRGVWDGTGITVQAVGGPAPEADPQPPTIQCDAAVSGAIAESGTALEIEATYARLQAEVDADPSTFAGVWVTSVGGQRAVALATTQDAALVATRIRGSFPYAFCVVRVSYSSSVLQQAAEAFSAYDPEIRESANRVVVYVPVLDDAAAALVAEHPSVFVKSLVVRDST